MNRTTIMLKIIIPLLLFTGFIHIKEVSQCAFSALQKSAVSNTSAIAVTKDTLQIDVSTGLVVDERLALIKANCTGCHSTKLIKQHRFSREGWVGKIRWMQQYHNLWKLGESEKPILDYLEKYYSPESTVNVRPARRAPLKSIEWYKL